MPGLPVAQATFTAKRVQDTDQDWRASPGDPRCALHAHHAARMAGLPLVGDRVHVTEAWFVPATYPSPGTLDGRQWATSIAGIDGTGFPRTCPGSCGRNGSVLWRGQVKARINAQDDWSQGAGITAASFIQSDPSRGFNDRVGRPGAPAPLSGGDGGGLALNHITPSLSGGDGLGPAYLDRPHQVLFVNAFNVTFALDMPDVGVTGYGRPASRGRVRLLFPLGPSAAVNRTLVRKARRLAGAVISTFDGSAPRSTLCTNISPTGTLFPRYSVMPPWTWFTHAPSGFLCSGGHSGPCQARLSGCVTTADILRVNHSDECERRCLLDSGVGASDSFHGPSSATLQVAYAPLVAWWKPCMACGPTAAVRAGSPSGPAPPCDEAQCVANLTRLLQRRLVRPNAVPLPMQLQALREADRSAFAWYVCASTVRQSFLSGLPLCTPLCEAGRGGSATRMVAWAGGPAESGSRAAGRVWLMAWSGSRGGGTARRCVAAADVVRGAAAQGRLSLSRWKAAVAGAASADWPDDLVSSVLSAASVNVTLRVPRGQLRRHTLAGLLTEVAAEAAAAAADWTPACVRSRCLRCPAASDGQVWSNASYDPASGRPYVPARATPLVELLLEITFLPMAGAGCDGAADTRRRWLVDARGQAGGEWGAPVAFVGPGSNASWAGAHAEAAAVASAHASSGALAASRSPAVRALSLHGALSDASSRRVLGLWLVWAAHHSPVLASRRCLLEDTPGAGPWWSGADDCAAVVQPVVVAACALVAATATAAAVAASLQPGVHCRRSSPRAGLARLAVAASQASFTSARALLVQSALRTVQAAACACVAMTAGRVSDVVMAASLVGLCLHTVWTAASCCQLAARGRVGPSGRGSGPGVPLSPVVAWRGARRREQSSTAPPEARGTAHAAPGSLNRAPPGELEASASATPPPPVARSPPRSALAAAASRSPPRSALAAAASRPATPSPTGQPPVSRRPGLAGPGSAQPWARREVPPSPALTTLAGLPRWVAVCVALASSGDPVRGLRAASLLRDALISLSAAEAMMSVPPLLLARLQGSGSAEEDEDDEDQEAAGTSDDGGWSAAEPTSRQALRAGGVLASASDGFGGDGGSLLEGVTLTHGALETARAEEKAQSPALPGARGQARWGPAAERRQGWRKASENSAAVAADAPGSWRADAAAMAERDGALPRPPAALRGRAQAVWASLLRLPGLFPELVCLVGGVLVMLVASESIPVLGHAAAVRLLAGTVMAGNPSSLAALQSEASHWLRSTDNLLLCTGVTGGLMSASAAAAVWLRLAE